MDNSKEIELDFLQRQFFKMLLKEFGSTIKITERMENWYKISWEKFREELVHQNITIDDTKSRDWEEYFHFHKNKVLSLL